VKIKIDKRDTVFSKIIRLRARFNCECCGRYFPKGHGLQCSHLVSRRHKATRWDFDAAVAHCFACHQRLGGNPLQFSAWIRKHLGDARYEMLLEKHQRIVKRTKVELEELYQHLKEQYELIVENPDYSPVSYD
jgi:hypothetical protein